MLDVPNALSAQCSDAWQLRLPQFTKNPFVPPKVCLSLYDCAAFPLHLHATWQASATTPAVTTCHVAGQSTDTHLGEELVLRTSEELNDRASDDGIDGELVHKLEAELV